MRRREGGLKTAIKGAETEGLRGSSMAVERASEAGKGGLIGSQRSERAQKWRKFLYEQKMHRGNDASSCQWISKKNEKMYGDKNASSC